MNLTEERIRHRAYEIWERHGRPAGMEKKHWDLARAELEQQISATASSPKKRAKAVKSTTPANPVAGAGRKPRT